MRSKLFTRLLITTSVIVSLLFTFNSCKKGDIDDGANQPPYYNLDVVLFANNVGHGHEGSGFIKFRQDPDTARIITLETWVRDLEPNHAYLLQRAVNPITDNSCTSTAWLTLGMGLTPQAINTDTKGNGHVNLFRNITAVARGSQFRIHFQIIDAITLAPVLSSDCYQYTVR